MRLAIFTHVLHSRKGENYYAYAPYVREMNIWLKHVKEVEIVAPLLPISPPHSEIPYEHNHLNFLEVPSFDLLSLRNMLRSLFKIPVIGYRVYESMGAADHLHLRCPGNIGLIACFVQILFPKKLKTAKYAGNWDPKSKQPWTYRLQKWILSNTFLTRNMQVLVYGQWSGQSRNVRPFFTASFSEEFIYEVEEKEFKPEFIFLFVGALVQGKRPLFAVEMVEKLRERGFEVSLELFGDGPLREELEIYCHGKRYIQLKGNRSLEELKPAYEKSHFVVLPSKSEGWPKAIAEGMFYGCIPVATSVSCVPWMLAHGKRGILVEPELEKAVEELATCLDNPGRLMEKSRAATEWSQQYTLEKFETAVREVLEESDKVETLCE